jgi:hypothetical protein
MQNTPLSTNLSAADIVTHCYNIGLVKRPAQPRVNAGGGGGGDSMAFAANPSHHQIPILVRKDQATGTFTDEHGFFGVVSSLICQRWFWLMLPR